MEVRGASRSTRRLLPSQKRLCTRKERMNNTTRILIVEDQRSDYELARHEIQKAILNCQFERVEKEADFLKALEIFKPDIILSDYKLPLFNAIRVLELVQQQSSFTPVIIWTGKLS